MIVFFYIFASEEGVLEISPNIKDTNQTLNKNIYNGIFN